MPPFIHFSSNLYIYLQWTERTVEAYEMKRNVSDTRHTIHSTEYGEKFSLWAPKKHLSHIKWYADTLQLSKASGIRLLKHLNTNKKKWEKEKNHKKITTSQDLWIWIHSSNRRIFSFQFSLHGRHPASIGHRTSSISVFLHVISSI